MMAKSFDIPDAASLTTQLVSLNTTSDKGTEEAAAEMLAGILEKAGFTTAFSSFAPGRTNLVARLEGECEGCMCFAGHLDTVPLGGGKWSVDPFGGEVRDGRMYGRGVSDMKSGVAAMTVAGLMAAREEKNRPGICLVYTAGEETGCQGAAYMAKNGLLPRDCELLIVTEPTGNVPCLGHKGATWAKGTVRGKAAHGSMPSEGKSALIPAARAVLALTAAFDGLPANPLLGPPTVNVGTFQAGSKVNMVPDLAVFEIDSRTTPEMDGHAILALMRQALGPEVELSDVSSLPHVLSDPELPAIKRALELINASGGWSETAQAMPYFTDASILAPGMDNPPTLIMGPGEPAQCHQTDEYCVIDKIDQAVKIFFSIIKDLQD